MKHGRLALAGLGGLLLAGCGATDYQRPAAVVEASKGLPQKVDYNWDVRPILSQNCFACHGNDAAKRKAGLRLDIKSSAYGVLPENKGAHAIVPGNPGRSELIQRILSKDSDLRMPPVDSHKTLSARDIAVLEKWIRDGAEYKQHWAYIPPKAVKPASSEWDKQAVNAVDRYIFAKLEQKGLRPSPEADRETLINRVTLDLTGLPPSLTEVDAFVNDKRPDAYEQLVDRLLASSTYGERMAEQWLDIARYSETDGYLDDLHQRTFWPYRDWVIQAFNRNMPFNQFATWQLAGDQLPKPSRDEILATAFGRLGKRSTENGIIEEEYRVEYRNERTEQVGKAFLGLTVGCARCHDHKYDAISQKDYYSLSGFFNSIDERGYYAAGSTNRNVGPTLDWPTAQQASALTKTSADASARAAAYDRAVAAAKPAAAKRVDAQLKGAASPTPLVQAAVSQATLAYYPLDEAHPGPIDQFKRGGRPQGQPAPAAAPARPAAPAGIIKVAAGGARPPAASARPPAGAPPPQPAQLPDGIAEKDLLLSSSGTPGIGDAGVERPILVPGVKGKAFYVKDNRGFMAPRVGWWDRDQDFAIDLWIKPRAGKVYEDATVVNHMDHMVSVADSGYNLALEKNIIRFDLNHASPYNKLSVATLEPLKPGQWVHIAVSYDGSSRARGIQIYLNGKSAKTEIRRDNLTRTILPTGRGGQFLGGDFYGFSWGKRFKSEEFTDGAIDEIRLMKRALTPVEAAWLHDPKGVGSAKAVREQLVELETARDPIVVKAKADLKAARDAENEVASAMPQVLVMADQPKVRPTYLLDRGVFDARKEEVRPAGLTQVFGWNRGKYGETRAGLAKWLFDKKNPLTSRVYVNRLWASHFGSGIVATVEDFGTQGSNPSHPELLDWLSTEFVRSGWDIKHLQKLIVMSATYRQSSRITPEVARADPTNVWLARGPRYRLSAEQIRDNALAASGLLVRKIGGDSVYPYQPPGLWTAAVSRSPYPDAPDDDMHRRSMYTFIKRSAPPPNMQVFDFADRQVSTVARPTSNTPLQALVLLNDPQFRDAYRALSEKVTAGSRDPAVQMEVLFRLATRRHPTAQERTILLSYRAKALDRMQADAKAVDQVLHTWPAPPPPAPPGPFGPPPPTPPQRPFRPVPAGLEPTEVAANMLVASAVMNSPAAYNLR